MNYLKLSKAEEISCKVVDDLLETYTEAEAIAGLVLAIHLMSETMNNQDGVLEEVMKLVEVGFPADLEEYDDLD